MEGVSSQAWLLRLPRRGHGLGQQAKESGRRGTENPKLIEGLEDRPPASVMTLLPFLTRRHFPSDKMSDILSPKKWNQLSEGS